MKAISRNRSRTAIALAAGLFAVQIGLAGCAGKTDEGRTVAVPKETDQEAAARFRNDSHMPPQARRAAVAQMQDAAHAAQMQQRREFLPPTPSPSPKK